MSPNHLVSFNGSFIRLLNIYQVSTTYQSLKSKNPKNPFDPSLTTNYQSKEHVSLGQWRRALYMPHTPRINKQYNFYTHGLLPTSNLCGKEGGCPLKEKKVSRSKASLITVSFKLKGSQKGGHRTNVGNKSLPLLSEGQSLNGRVLGIYPAHLLRNGFGEEISAGALLI